MPVSKLKNKISQKIKYLIITFGLLFFSYAQSNNLEQNSSSCLGLNQLKEVYAYLRNREEFSLANFKLTDYQKELNIFKTAVKDDCLCIDFIRNDKCLFWGPETDFFLSLLILDIYSQLTKKEWLKSWQDFSVFFAFMSKVNKKNTFSFWEKMINWQSKFFLCLINSQIYSQLDKEQLIWLEDNLSKIKLPQEQLRNFINEQLNESIKLIKQGIANIKDPTVEEERVINKAKSLFISQYNQLKELFGNIMNTNDQNDWQKIKNYLANLELSQKETVKEKIKYGWQVFISRFSPEFKENFYFNLAEKFSRQWQRKNKIIIEALTDIVNKYYILKAQENLIEIGTYASLYYYDKNNWPEDITQLKKAGYSSGNWLDPFNSNQPFKMKIIGKNLLVYSLGPDRSDQEGILLWHPGQQKGDIVILLTPIQRNSNNKK